MKRSKKNKETSSDDFADSYKEEDELDRFDDRKGDSDDDDAAVDKSEEPASFSGSVLGGTLKKKNKSGGFQAMGLSYPILKGVLTKGYKVPTPIQRKAIPIIMEGKDVVAMARTGSGKTGAFLVPMLERLKAKTSKAGARALIFSPTRELAMQTLKFTKELAKFTGLKALLVLGGEKMEDQFAAIHENPDIIIATPGRFLHLVIEMDLKLSSIEYVVFDEADRLFEMGFQEQIQEVLHRLPENRQTLMFSATLPRLLVDFVRAGLSDPILIRLDLEMKLSENLKTIYLTCRLSDKPAILLHLLKNVIDLKKELTVVFLATRHHVEYIKDVLSKASVPCSYIYSSLDHTARKIHVAKFKAHQVGVLLVTDIAARGIDIPLLDNVINYNFPSKPKLFVHRVGRVARAGRTGIAYSLVSPDELPYLIDLHLFLGKPVAFADDESTGKDGVCGSVPQSLIDDEVDQLNVYHESHLDLRNMTKVCDNAYKQYIKSRPAPSSESIKRVKELPLHLGKVHPIFNNSEGLEIERSKFLAGMRSYRPNTTIFELGATGKSEASAVMRNKRLHHSVVNRIRDVSARSSANAKEPKNSRPSVDLAEASESEIQAAFGSSIRKHKNLRESKKKKTENFKDAEHYLPYMSSEYYTEKGLGLQNNFEADASKAVLDLTADDAVANNKQKNAWHWDRKKKRFMKEDNNETRKKIKTENGVWIPKSYKSDLYEKWRSKNKIAFQNDSDEEDPAGRNRKKFLKNSGTEKGGFKKKFGGVRDKKNNEKQRRELKTKEEILKHRKRSMKRIAYQKRKYSERSKKKSKK